LEIAPEHRSLLLEGMRGAVRFGTAKNAALDVPGLYIFGKTGTSTPDQGFALKVGSWVLRLKRLAKLRPPQQR